MYKTKKTIVLILSLLTSCLHIYGQNSISNHLIDDIDTLSDLITNKDKESVARILLKYTNGNLTGDDTVLTYFTSNPYLWPILKDIANEKNNGQSDGNKTTTIDIANEEDDGLREMTISPPPSLISTSSSFVSLAADGLATFLVERTKEELRIAFFDKLNSQIKKNDLNEIFQESATTLDKIGDEIYNYRLYLSTLQSSFRNDLQVLPENIGKYVKQLPDDKIIVHKKNLIADLLIIGQLIADEENIHLLLSRLAETSITELNKPEYLNETTDKEINRIKDIRNSFVLVGIISNSLVANDTLKNYISLSKFDSILDDNDKTNLYLGLIWQLLTNYKVEIGGNSIASKLIAIANPAGPHSERKNHLENLKPLISHGKTIVGYLNKLKDNSFDKESEEATYLYYNIVNQVFSSAKTILGFTQISPGSKVHEGIRAFEAGLKIPIDLGRNNYSNAIVNIHEVLELGLGDSENKTIKAFLKYGGFIAAVASSKSGSEISAILNNYALPVGSYIQKRRSTSCNIALNGYVGVFGGSETLNLNDVRETTMNVSHFSLGVTAPIGLAISWSLHQKSAFTLFPTVLDLGTVVSYRFDNNNSSELPEFNLQNIIAPGIQGSFGIPSTPIVMSGGWQRGPLFREIQMPFSGTVGANRWFINISVDIPLFTLKSGQ